MEYGDIVEFECRVPDCNSIFQLLVNGNLDIENERLVSLDQREYGSSISCDNTKSEEGQHVAKFWMFVNSRTLQTVSYVSCKFIGIEPIPVFSEIAYINLLLPTNIVTVTVNDEKTGDNASSCENSETFNKAQAIISNPLVLLVTLWFACQTVSIYL